MPMSGYMKQLRQKVGTLLLEIPAVSVAVCDDGGRLLLIRHSERGQWMIPGGAVEPLEPPADAAIREMWEETGLTVELTRLIGVYGGADYLVRYSNGDEVSYLTVLFAARRLSGDARPDGTEVLEIGYFHQAEAEQLDMPRWMPEILQAVFDTAHVGFRRPTWLPEA